MQQDSPISLSTKPVTQYEVSSDVLSLKVRFSFIDSVDLFIILGSFFDRVAADCLIDYDTLLASVI